MPDEYDSPWKEALEVFLRPMLEFCFPLVATAIDWSVPPVFMDKELQEIAGDSALGRQTVDKLVRVELLDGREEWALVHIEVQHQRDVVYRLLDWLMRLPEGLEREYKSELRRFEESRAMPYVTSIERMGREEGRQEGRQIGRVESLRENIVDVLEARFGAVSRRVKARINAEGDGKRLKVLLRSAVTSGTLQEFKRITGLKDRRNTRTTGLETLR